MTVQQSDRRDTDRVLEKEIVRYLRNHPEFFEAHLDLLADMVLPHQSYGTVSLIERQVSVLREQKDELRKRLNRLMDTARLNEKLNERINAFILDLLDAQTLDEILTVVRSRLTDDFAADAVVVRLFKPADAAMASRPEFVDWSEPVLGAFENVIRDRKPVCGKLKPGQLDSLFSDQADNIASAALIPLIGSDASTCYGLLAIGSRDRNRFHADMGILFLTHLGNIVSRVLKPHLGAS